MAGKDGDKQLRRIILMLLSLASLAERASRAPWPVRCLVLWALRWGEAAACDFVSEITQTPLGVIDLSAFPDDNSPAGALCLAMRLTALAAALQQMLCGLPRFGRNARRDHDAGGPRLVVRHLSDRWPVGLPGSRAPPPHVREGRQASLQSENGLLERFGVSGDKASARQTPIASYFVRRTILLAIYARSAHMGLGAWAALAAFPWMDWLRQVRRKAGLRQRNRADFLARLSFH